MSNTNKVINRIELSDTISQFMEKCNKNFSTITEWGGGPAGIQGEEGGQGVPTKPKVPIHVWKKGKKEDGCQYKDEVTTFDSFEINVWYEDLTDSKYQDGHLIMLENGHVYILKIDDKDNFSLKPNYLISMQTYDPSDVIDGKNAYVHIAYTNDINNFDDFETDQQLRGEELESIESNVIETFSVINKAYIGIYSDNTNASSINPNRYTWVKAKGSPGEKGERGEKGEKGDVGPKGDGYTGHQYTIDVEGYMSTISIDIDRTRLYDESGDYCECKLHAYYGDENVYLDYSDVKINLPDEYIYSDNYNIVLKSDNTINVGKLEKKNDGNDVIIRFTPDENFVFPKKAITFFIHVDTFINDKIDQNTYYFVRDNVWMINGIMSTFELDIVPQHRIIKLYEDGTYYPEKLLVDVYKVNDSERTLFNFSKNTEFTLLYKNINNNDWTPYTTEGIDTRGISCIEFKVVRYYGSTDEEIWDYEDVWVVADGKGTHYYHADLGSTESMMVLVTGEKINIGKIGDPIYCAKLRNESGYSITFDPKFYDGTEEFKVKSVNIGTNSGEQYYSDGSFERTLEGTIEEGYTLTITKVPYDVEVIPMMIDVTADCPIYDNLGNITKYEEKRDSVSFNVYITTLSDIYTLVPTVSSYNTSSGKDGDKIGCSVYKNTTLINTKDLTNNNLSLQYIIYNGNDENKKLNDYSEELVYGHDDIKNYFTANDLAIEFILSYTNKEIVREVVKSTVPLVKDGIDGKDGDSWQYIFYKSSEYPFPFSETEKDPSTWVKDKIIPVENLTNPNDEYILKDSGWYDDHQGVDETNKYEYQSYRKWDKVNKKWGEYGSPTLYSNYSENGKDGETPTCEGTQVVGYSLSNLDADPNNEGWKPSISDLNPNPGDIIYILNEYTWSTGNTTYIVTSTMAGTQGASGKSRVLFYLGSFKDGTLNTSNTIYGQLTDDRCDYYIDSNDQAWMRTGTKTEAEAKPNGNNNSSYWKKSEKIGFLQAGAISADMINADTFVGSEVIATAVNAAEINADNIKTGTIKSNDEKSYFNLDTGEFVLGDDGNGGGALSYIGGKLHIGGSQTETDSDITELLNQMGVLNDKINNIGGENLLQTTSYNHLYNAGDTVYFTKLMDLEAGKKYIATYGKFENNAGGATNEVFNDVCLAIGTSGSLENIEMVVKFGEPFDVNYNGRDLYLAWALGDYVNYVKGTSPNVETTTTFTQYIDEVMVQEGEVATSFQPSMYETINPISTEIDSYKYLKSALENDTDIAGGLVASSQIQLRDKVGSEYVVNAGISGINDDNILMWGGGTYDEAYAAANSENYYKSGTTPITTLIKKDGTGKIGIFKISETQAVVDVPNQGKVIIDAGEDNGGIRILNSEGRINAALLPTSISSFKPLANNTVTSGEQSVYYSMGTQSVTSTSKTIKLSRTGSFTTSGTTTETLEQYTKTTTITTSSTGVGGNTVTLSGDIRTSNHDMIVVITCELLYNGNSIYSTSHYEEVQVGYNYISLSGVKLSFPNSIKKTLTVSNSMDMKLKVTVTITNASSDAYIDAVSLGVSMGSIYMFYKATTAVTYTYSPQTIIGSDGLISLVSNDKYFMVDNTGSTQKIYAKGLSATKGSTAGSGELYVSNYTNAGLIKTLYEGFAAISEVLEHCKYEGSNTKAQENAKNACTDIRTALAQISIIANT